MSSKMKKQITLLALLCMMLFAFTACSNSNDGNSQNNNDANQNVDSSSEQQDNEPSDSEGNEADEMKETFEISWIGQRATGFIEDDNAVQKMLEEKFNVELENSSVAISVPDQRNLMMASGELTDYAYILNDDPYKLHADGMTRTIPREMIEKYAPNYAAFLDSVPTGWEVNKLTKDSDEYVGLTGYNGAIENLYWGQAYRLDWMKELGIEPKGEIQPLGTEGDHKRVYYTLEPYTLAEEIELYEAFATMDPNNSGTKDTFGITLHNNGFPWAMATTAGAFGFGWQKYIEEDGELTYSSISNKYKNMLQHLASLYDKGIIDPEFTTLNLAKGWEKFAQGYYGSAQSLLFAATQLETYGNRPLANLIVRDPEAEVLFAPPPIGPDGHQGAAMWGNNIDGMSYQAVINADVSDEKLARILQIFDYVNMDQEGYVRTQFGEEGVDFEWEGEPYASGIKTITDFDTQEAKGVGYYNHVVRTPELLRYWNDKFSTKLLNAYWGTEEGKSTIYRDARFDYYNETKFDELQAEYKSRLDTIVNEYMFQAIIGEVEIDETWDAYVQNYLSSGGQKLLDELAKAPRTSDILGQ